MIEQGGLNPAIRPNDLSNNIEIMMKLQHQSLCDVNRHWTMGVW